jgi:hypothetical protein
VSLAVSASSFECLPTKLAAILEKAHARLRQRHKIGQPIIVRTIAELGVLCKAGIPPISRPDYIGVIATFLSTQAKTVPVLPLSSRRGDICVFEIRGPKEQEEFSARLYVGTIPIAALPSAT